MNFLSPCHASGALLELRQGWQQGFADFEHPKQAQQPEHPQVHADQAGQVKRGDRQQINDGVAATDEAQSGKSGLGKFWVRRCGPPTQQVFHGEHNDREGFKCGQFNRISGFECIGSFQHHGQDI